MCFILFHPPSRRLRFGPSRFSRDPLDFQPHHQNASHFSVMKTCRMEEAKCEHSWILVKNLVDSESRENVGLEFHS